MTPDTPAEGGEDWAMIEAFIYCPIHKIRECSPLLNGCSRVNNAYAVLARLEARLQTQGGALKEILKFHIDYGDGDSAVERIARAALDASSEGP